MHEETIVKKCDEMKAPDSNKRKHTKFNGHKDGSMNAR